MQNIRVHFDKDHSITLKEESLNEITGVEITKTKILQLRNLQNDDVFVNVDQIQYITYEVKD